MCITYRKRKKRKSIGSPIRKMKMHLKKKESCMLEKISVMKNRGKIVMCRCTNIHAESYKHAKIKNPITMVKN